MFGKPKFCAVVSKKGAKINPPDCGLEFDKQLFFMATAPVLLLLVHNLTAIKQMLTPVA